jgi:hypothetical protein
MDIEKVWKCAVIGWMHIYVIWEITESQNASIIKATLFHQGLRMEHKLKKSFLMLVSLIHILGMANIFVLYSRSYRDWDQGVRSKAEVPKTHLAKKPRYSFTWRCLSVMFEGSQEPFGFWLAKCAVGLFCIRTLENYFKISLDVSWEMSRYSNLQWNNVNFGGRL